MDPRLELLARVHVAIAEGYSRYVQLGIPIDKRVCSLLIEAASSLPREFLMAHPDAIDFVKNVLCPLDSQRREWTFRQIGQAAATMTPEERCAFVWSAREIDESWFKSIVHEIVTFVDPYGLIDFEKDHVRLGRLLGLVTEMSWNAEADRTADSTNI